MLAEPELGESADPRALVRGDPAAVRATAERLAALAAGCAATAGGLDAIGVRGWSGAAASAFRERHAELSARWSRAAAAFRSAAQAWERFGIELVAAQELAAGAVARFATAGGPLAAEAGLLGVTQHVAGQASAGPAVSAQAQAGVVRGTPAESALAHAGRVVRGGPAVAAPAHAGRVVRGQAPGAWATPGPTPADSAFSAGAQVADLDAARRMLAEARARRDRAAVAAAREIAAAAALAPNPPGDGERRALAAADWVRANGVALGHVARGAGEGVEDLLRFARLVNPADPYNLNHPGRFLANASTALAGAVDDVVHPLRQVAAFVGPGWGSDPARAYGHLLPTAVLTAVTGAGRSTVRGPGPRPAPAALGATEPAPLWTDPRPTARPFTPAPPPPPAALPAAPPPPAALPAPARPSPDPPAVPASPAPAAAAPPPSTPGPLAPDGVASPPPAAAAQTPAPPSSPTQPPAPPEGPAAGGAADEASSSAASSATTGAATAGAAPTSGAVVAADGAAAGRLAEIARRLPSDPAKLTPRDVAEPDPHHDPERARRARVTRADKDFTGTRASRGNRKSHLDEHGHLVPANPAGAASVVEHVVGRRSRTKDDSPYSSFTAPGARAAVDFGGSVIEVDIVRLQADIDAGRVPDVDIVAPHRVQAAIQADADRIAGRPVDLYVRKGRIPDAARSYGLDAEATAALRQRMIDMANAQRHHEWMIRGIVPSRYIIGPHPGRSDG